LSKAVKTGGHFLGLGGTGGLKITRDRLFFTCKNSLLSALGGQGS